MNEASKPLGPDPGIGQDRERAQGPGRGARDPPRRDRAIRRGTLVPVMTNHEAAILRLEREVSQLAQRIGALERARTPAAEQSALAQWYDPASTWGAPTVPFGGCTAVPTVLTAHDSKYGPFPLTYDPASGTFVGCKVVAFSGAGAVPGPRGDRHPARPREPGHAQDLLEVGRGHQWLPGRVGVRRHAERVVPVERRRLVLRRSRRSSTRATPRGATPSSATGPTMASRSPLEEERAAALEVLIARTRPARDRDLCDPAHPAFLSLARSHATPGSTVLDCRARQGSTRRPGVDRLTGVRPLHLFRHRRPWLHLGGAGVGVLRVGPGRRDERRLR